MNPFASYSEALYYQHAFGDDEFYSYMIGKLDDYLGGNVSTAHKVPFGNEGLRHPFRYV